MLQLWTVYVAKKKIGKRSIVKKDFQVNVITTIPGDISYTAIAAGHLKILKTGPYYPLHSTAAFNELFFEAIQGEK